MSDALILDGLSGSRLAVALDDAERKVLAGVMSLAST